MLNKIAKMALFRRSENTGITQDEKAFNEVFKVQFDSLYNYGLKITGKSDLVEDSIQEVFFRIWRNNIDLNTVSNVKSYLFKALRRQLFNVLKLKSSQTFSIEYELNGEMEFSPEDFIITSQAEEEIQKNVMLALNRLPDRQREAIYLRYFENLSFDEISAVMNINTQSVKNSVFRGIETMRKMFPGIILLNYLNF